jgi:hypothetical protein
MSEGVTQLTLWDESPKLKPYWEWEDYKHGMFKATDKREFNQKLIEAISILSNSDNCRKFMGMVVSEWPVATRQNLYDSSVNRRPWLGRACCCIAHCISDDVVREAWWRLTDDQRFAANEVADQVISKWEFEYAQAYA